MSTMITEFSSLEEAKTVAASIIGIDPANFEEDLGLRCVGMEALLLNNSKVSKEIKQSIQNKINNQKGFKVNKDGKEIRIIISPFANGFDCCFIGENGFGMRI